jgi:hypothetical protein
MLLRREITERDTALAELVATPQEEMLEFRGYVTDWLTRHPN